MCERGDRVIELRGETRNHVFRHQRMTINYCTSVAGLNHRFGPGRFLSGSGSDFSNRPYPDPAELKLCRNFFQQEFFNTETAIKPY
jgi:hypothetical protein